jgi:hypothetical protein
VTKKKNNGGRPSKLTPIVKSAIELLASGGMTDAQMSKIIGVTANTFDKWKTKHPEFFKTLKDWKRTADKNVERSLYERACGYEHDEDKIFSYGGEALIVPTTKHYPPDSTAIIFWLKNRQPDRWRDVKEQIHSIGKETAKHVYGHLDKLSK